MVGVRGFEPPAPASRTQCSTRLSYTPTLARNGVAPAQGPAIYRSSSARASGVLNAIARGIARLNLKGLERAGDRPESDASVEPSAKADSLSPLLASIRPYPFCSEKSRAGLTH